jgi:hypothetical protein
MPALHFKADPLFLEKEGEVRFFIREPSHPHLFSSEPARGDVDARDIPRIKSGHGHDAYFFTRAFRSNYFPTRP